MAVGLARHRVGKAARMWRRRAPREARDGEVERAPEEMRGAGLARKAGAEAPHHRRDPEERGVKALHGLAMGGPRGGGVCEGHLVGRPVDGEASAHRLHGPARPGGEVRHAHGAEGEGFARAALGLRDERMVHQVKRRGRRPGPVVRPRATTWSVACRERLTRGACASRCLPKLWLHGWSAAQVPARGAQEISGHSPASPAPIAVSFGRGGRTSPPWPRPARPARRPNAVDLRGRPSARGCRAGSSCSTRSAAPRVAGPRSGGVRRARGARGLRGWRALARRGAPTALAARSPARPRRRGSHPLPAGPRPITFSGCDLPSAREAAI